jgi:hypothetical protein
MPRRSRPGGLATAFALALLAVCITRGLMPSQTSGIRATPAFTAMAPPQVAALAALGHTAVFQGGAVRHRAAPVAAHVMGKPRESGWAVWDGAMHRLWRWLTAARTRTGR